MKIAFLNLCHEDPAIVARAAEKLMKREDFGMYVHVDLKSDAEPFIAALRDINRVFFIENRCRVYWGGFNAVSATVELLRAALSSPAGYDYFFLLQNSDYPIRGNDQITDFFSERNGTEFIRGCPIARSRDWHYAMKYKIFNKRDDDFYLKKHSERRMCLRHARMALMSAGTVFNNGVVKDGEKYDLYYGAAQWAVTRELAAYFVNFYDARRKFNSYMRRVQFPDEIYFHTVAHNSAFREKCVKYGEEQKRWLVNWRNLHYFEYPKGCKIMTEDDYGVIMNSGALFVRKVRTGESDGLLDKIDRII